MPTDVSISPEAVHEACYAMNDESRILADGKQCAYWKDSKGTILQGCMSTPFEQTGAPIWAC